MMFSLFPHAAKVLERDRGFCKGPRPVYFFDTNPRNSLLRDLLLKNPRVVVLFRDEFDIEESDNADIEDLKCVLQTIIPEMTLVQCFGMVICSFVLFL